MKVMDRSLSSVALFLFISAPSLIGGVHSSPLSGHYYFYYSSIIAKMAENRDNEQIMSAKMNE